MARAVWLKLHWFDLFARGRRGCRLVRRDNKSHQWSLSLNSRRRLPTLSGTITGRYVYSSIQTCVTTVS